MNRNDFNRFITGGAFPGPGDLDGIRELTDMFPWFHAAHLVLLRGLKENADIRFDSQLKSSALSVSDREVLYHYLFMQPAVETEAVVREETEAEPEVEVKDEAEPVVEVKNEIEAEPVVDVKDEIEAEPVVEVQEEIEAAVEAAVESEEEEKPSVSVAVETEEEEKPSVSVAEEPVIRSREELVAEIEARLGELASLADRVLELDHSESPVNEVYKAAEPSVITEPAPEEELLEFIPDSEPPVPEPVPQLSPADLIDRFIIDKPAH